MHGADRDRSNDEISLIVAPDALNSIATGLQALVVQSFFALRCYRVLPRRARWVALPVFAALILGAFGGALTFATIALINHGSSSADRGAVPGTAERLMDSAMVCARHCRSTLTWPGLALLRGGSRHVRQLSTCCH